ncbi:MarR family winged helix-turn-helix transcriptional regulator [Streptomyces sp. NPDC089919]|uniref:MarR family winged helix-turn-helix transcriptional regulator n=1 Tax=Streptomyces sp. NPDC089919 TaxID=3155188 RepID=UPI00342DCBB3
MTTTPNAPAQASTTGPVTSGPAGPDAARPGGTPAAAADPAATDEMLPSQPVGYWSGHAHRAVIGHIRDAMARIDVSQPLWWTLNRVQRAGDRATRPVVIGDLTGFTDGPDDVPRAIDQLLHRGWLAEDPAGRLTVTGTGRTAMAEIKQLVDDLRTEIHQGVSDEDYVTTLRVLRRMADNIAAARAGR